MDMPFGMFKKDQDKSFIVDYAPIFANLNLFEKNLIIERSKVVEYKKDDLIYKELDPPDAFYCVITGRVRIVSGKRKNETLEYLHCGNYFGIISLLTGDSHSVNAIAANDSKILKIEKDDFQVILSHIPHLAIDLSKTLSKRLRKKDTEEKKIFESNIISIFSAVKGIGRTRYAVSLAVNLKKETERNVLLLDISKRANEVCRALDIAKTDDSDWAVIKLDTPFFTSKVIQSAIIKDEPSGLDILNVAHEHSDGRYTANLSALLTQLAGEYHYVVVDLLAEPDDVVYQALRQSDIINIVTDNNIENLGKTKVLIEGLEKRIKLPQDKLKIVINEKKGQGYLSAKEAPGFLGNKIYAVLPMFWGDSHEDKAARQLLEDEYNKTLRRIVREIGDVRVGLALSGGAAFGLAHVGVIKVLERENIPIDVVVGSSMGALIAAFWAAGLNASELEKVLIEFNSPRKVFHLLLDFCFPKLSFAKGKRIKKFLHKVIDKKTFQDANIPIKIVACNISKRSKFIFESGSLADAVMASIAIPGLFAPVKVNGDLLVDGGIIEPVPIATLVKMGIKKIIAVDTLPRPEHILQNYDFNQKQSELLMKQAKAKGFFAKIAYRLKARMKNAFFPNIFDVIVNSIQTLESAVSESNCQMADVVVRPFALGADWFEFYKIEALIEKGEEETKKALPDIKNLLKE